MESNNLTQIVSVQKPYIENGSKVQYMALCEITIASILQYNVLRPEGEYKSKRNL